MPNRVELTDEVLNAFSDVEQMYFNTAVALADPETLVRATPLVESFTEAFLKAVKNAGESVADQMAGVAGTSQDLLALARAVSEELVDLTAHGLKLSWGKCGTVLTSATTRDALLELALGGPCHRHPQGPRPPHRGTVRSKRLPLLHRHARRAFRASPAAAGS